ncbi:MoaD/ThiS family protein [Asticcacaulis machinosus]|uniref:MoaD/ThiS family protein n=1 Tax=Asticcacaulis machinosus TaxID=2984211 RepID=A0ABT5HJG0_9CAUL|nr:MoaD/ThiS family protein [Asticcacaulis machinosus]MDC7676381.1 MoaD/ThiS family protein [Asticcacaulis machinosus]
MIRVLFFGKISDLIGQREITVPHEPGSSLHRLRDTVFNDLMAAQALKACDIHMSVNQTKAREDITLNDTDEVAFFSVFSGG